MSHSAVVPPPRGWLKRTLTIVLRIIGAPDYDRYVAHMQKQHPECELLSRTEFVRERQNDKYTKPGSRCC